MAILHCPACHYLQEVPNQHLGKSARCPACQGTAPVVDTVKLLDGALKKNRLMDEHFANLRAKHAEHTEQLASAVKQHVSTSRENKTLHRELAQLREENASLRERSADSAPIPEIAGELSAEGYAFENQDYAASLNNFQPIVEWFKSRQIQVLPNTKASDISGYFDEIAVLLGDHYAVLARFLKQLCFHQRKEHRVMHFKLDTTPKQEANIIKEFCRSAYYPTLDS